MSDQPTTYAPPAPPTEGPPPLTSTAAPQPGGAPKKRKGRGCLVGCLIALLVIVVLAVGGFMVIRSAAKPKDLGVTYTEKDYWSAMEKAGVQVNEVPDGEEWASTDVVYSGSKQIDETFTPSEVSALFAYSHASGWPVSNAQVRFTGGDGVEIAASIEYAGQATRSMRKHPPNQRQHDQRLAPSAEVLGITVPSQYSPLVRATRWGSSTRGWLA